MSTPCNSKCRSGWEKPQHFRITRADIDRADTLGHVNRPLAQLGQGVIERLPQNRGIWQDVSRQQAALDRQGAFIGQSQAGQPDDGCTFCQLKRCAIARAPWTDVARQPDCAPGLPALAQIFGQRQDRQRRTLPDR